MSVRLRIALTIFITGALTAIGVIATVLFAFQRFEQPPQRCFTLLQEVQHCAPRRTRPQAGQPRQGLSQRFDLG